MDRTEVVSTMYHSVSTTPTCAPLHSVMQQSLSSAAKVEKRVTEREDGCFLSSPQHGTSQILAGNRGGLPQSIVHSELHKSF